MSPTISTRNANVAIAENYWRFQTAAAEFKTILRWANKVFVWRRYK